MLPLAVILGTVVAILRLEKKLAYKDKPVGQGWQKTKWKEPESLENINVPQN